MDPAEKNKIRAANIRAVWDALLAPNWNKNDLIDLGKAIYARRALRDLDPKRFDQLLPRLVEVVERLEDKFTPAAHEAAPPIPTEPRGVDGPAGTSCPSGELGPVGQAGQAGSAGPGPCPTGPAGRDPTTHPTTQGGVTSSTGPAAPAKPAAPEPEPPKE